MQIRLGPKSVCSGWKVGRLLQPERAAVKLFETPAIEEDRAEFSRRATIIPADPDVAVSREHIRQFGDLFVEGLLHAKDVGCGRPKHTSQEHLSAPANRIDSRSARVPCHEGCSR